MLSFLPLALCRRRPAFRDGIGNARSRRDLGGDVEGAVTGAVLGEIGVPVVTGADDIEIVLPVP